MNFKMTVNIVYCAFWVLYISNLIVSTNAAPLTNDNILQNKQKDCQVNKKYKDSNWSGETIPFTVYVEEEEDAGAVSFSITYEDKDINLFRDKSIISQKENKIYEYRNGNIEEKSLKTYIDGSGWIQMEISMKNQRIIVKVMGIVVLNHTASFSVKGLVIHGKHITVCEDNTPTWLVQHEVLAKIPLEPSRQVVDHSGNRTYVLTLNSDNEFIPCIGVGGRRKCLTQENLSERRIDLYLELITGYINVYQKIGGKRENLINFYKQEMKYIEVTSNKNKFSVSLTIFNQPKEFPPDSDSAVNSDYGTAIYMGIGIGLTIGIALCSVIAIVVVLVRRHMQINDENNFSETIKKNDTSNELTHLHDDNYN